MPTTEPTFDARFARRFAAWTGVVPLVLLVWDARHGNLGVNAVNYAIRTTGLLGLIFLTAALAVTPIRRLLDWSALIAARRAFGLLGFTYIAIHFLIFFWWDRDRSLSSTLEEVVERRYLQLGFLALVLMIPLAVTSTDAMVRRLGARRWKRLHRATYAVVILGVLHFWLLVKADTSRPKTFAVIVGALLVARLIPSRKRAPVTRRPRFWQGELVVERVTQETHDVRTFRLRPVDGGPLPFTYQPGQYLNLALTIDGHRVPRSYTIASTPSRPGFVEITVKRKAGGYGSHAVHDQLVEGARVKVGAPAGKFVFTGDGADRVLLLAGGVGITPLMAITRFLTDRGWKGEIHLVNAVRSPDDIIFADELAALAAKHPNLHVTHVTRGFITAEVLTAAVPDLAGVPVFLCGPDPMMAAMRALLIGLGVPDEVIHTEAFVSPATPSSDAVAAPEAVTAIDGPATISFARSKKGCDGVGLTVLEAAEDCGVDLPYECRSGICGQCKIPLLAGKVTMDSQDALTAAERARGLILACQARATADIAVDA